jgi:hypothetical protein
MHVHAVTRESLIKLPAVFAGVGILAQIGTRLPDSHAALAALTVSLGASLLLGARRGAQMPVWRGTDGSWLTQGNRLTMGLWIALIVFKFVLGAVGNVTGWFPTETVGEIFITLGLSFAIQNVIVAHRSIARQPQVIRSAA